MSFAEVFAAQDIKKSLTRCGSGYSANPNQGKKENKNDSRPLFPCLWKVMAVVVKRLTGDGHTSKTSALD